MPLKDSLFIFAFKVFNSKLLQSFDPVFVPFDDFIYQPVTGKLIADAAEICVMFFAAAVDPAAVRPKLYTFAFRFAAALAFTVFLVAATIAAPAAGVYF
jgi:hypothetical protein